MLQNFNNRELAAAIWILIAVILVFSKQKYRKSLFEVIKTFFAWKLVISYLLMFSYITIIVIPLKILGLWKVSHLPMTILWILGVAFVMLFQFPKAKNPNFFKDSFKDNIKVLVIIEFIINLYVFDLWFELILLPFFFILGGMIAVTESDKKYEIVNKFLNYIITFISLTFLSYAIYMLVTDFKHFATLQNLENFYLPIFLSIMFLPFVYFAALFASYESFFVRLQFFIKDASVLKYAKMKTILTFNIYLWELNKWAEHVYSSWRFETRAEVDKAVRDFKNKAS